MSSSQLKDKWDSRYRESDISDATPATVLKENTYLLPDKGIALDMGCGLGANAILLAHNNLSVVAWDISEIAIGKLNQYAKQQGLDINAQMRDVEIDSLEKNFFDVIVIAHFLERSLTQQIIDALKPGGLLFYQTFTQTKVSAQGPTRLEYRLANNELLTMFSDLQILVYREEGTTGDTTKGFRDQALLIAKK